MRHLAADRKRRSKSRREPAVSAIVSSHIVGRPRCRSAPADRSDDLVERQDARADHEGGPDQSDSCSVDAKAGNLSQEQNLLLHACPLSSPIPKGPLNWAGPE